jgi:hypothetical protein
MIPKLVSANELRQPLLKRPAQNSKTAEPVGRRKWRRNMPLRTLELVMGSYYGFSYR